MKDGWYHGLLNQVEGRKIMCDPLHKLSDEWLIEFLTLTEKHIQIHNASVKKLQTWEQIAYDCLQCTTTNLP